MLREKVSKGLYDEGDLKEFWYIVKNAGLLLRESNPVLAERAGLGAGFFSTAARDQRSPKLQNFLRALTAVIEVANERLFEIDENFVQVEYDKSISKNLQNNDKVGDLILMSISLAHIAKKEIDRIDSTVPNEIKLYNEYQKQRDILMILFEGFSQISAVLNEMSINPADKSIAGKASGIINSISEKTEEWWKENNKEAIDWMFRVPILGAGVATLNACGANMTIGTSVIAALVGGSKVVNILGKVKKPKR